MRVVHLNNSDSQGGAARASYRLHCALLASGVDSKFVVNRKLTDDYTVIGPSNKIAQGTALIKASVEAVPLLLYPKRKKSIFSPANIPDRLIHKLNKIPHDILNLHWINGGFIKIETLAKLGKPIVWTLHDMWAFTGGCHVDGNCERYLNSCGKCPKLGSQHKKDLSYKILKRKKSSWKNLNITLVTPSKWLADCARRSSLFSNRRIEVIPNGVNITHFKPLSKEYCKNILGVSPNSKILLFGAMGATSDRNKGFHLLQAALKLLQQSELQSKLQIVIFGESEPLNPPDLGFPTQYLGYLNDSISLSVIFSSADVLVMPSIQENLPNTILESLACGTPSVAFNIGGIPDIIEHKVNGYLAKRFDCGDLANGIKWLINNENYKKLSQAAFNKAISTYDIRRVASKYQELYEELIKT